MSELTAQPPAATPQWHPSGAVAADYSGRSNLAAAFLCLPRDKRADMDVFYTFCRLIDDIADSDTLPDEQQALYLNAWKDALRQPSPVVGPTSAAADGESLLINQIHALIIKYRLPVEHFLEIIAGVEMDLTPRQYATFDELAAYCYRVASVVGLVSIEIFGYRNEACRQYALDLGMALQITNILRDVAVDLDNGGRIYLPLEDMARFGYSVEDLRRRTHDDRFLALMRFESERAEEYYRRAVRSLPPEDRCSMVAAEIMRAIYYRLLRRLQRGDFRVFDRSYRLGKWSKLSTMALAVVNNRLGR
jgi:phytoene synthase